MRIKWCLSVLVALAVAPLASTRGTQLSGIPACLHDQGEQAEHRGRREQAMALVKTINARQGEAIERTRLYPALTQLRNLPPAPRGFDVRLYTDGRGYVVSIKDTLDPCRYAIFSDESGLVYEKSAFAAPFLATGS